MKQNWVDQLNAAGSPKCTEIKKELAVFCIEPQNLLSMVRKLWDFEYYLQDVAAADFQEGYLLTYHFAHFQEPGQAVFRVLIPHDPPDVPSISSIYDGAIWHEQECFDFYGINFTDHPDLKPLLLVPDENLYPLRKDARSRKSLHEAFPQCALVEAPAVPEQADTGEPAAGEQSQPKKAPRKAKAEEPKT